MESTGWANFDNFENSSNTQNVISEDKKSCDESKEEIPEIEMKLTEKTVVSSETVEDNNENNKGTIDSEAPGTDVTSVETNSADESDENSTNSLCSADKNANPSEPLPNRYFGLLVLKSVLSLHNSINICIIHCRDPKSTEIDEEIKDITTDTIKSEKLPTEHEISPIVKSTSIEPVLVSEDAK